VTAFKKIRQDSITLFARTTSVNVKTELDVKTAAEALAQIAISQSGMMIDCAGP
jgi:hypothetical protein